MDISSGTHTLEVPEINTGRIDSRRYGEKSQDLTLDISTMLSKNLNPKRVVGKNRKSESTIISQQPAQKKRHKMKSTIDSRRKNSTIEPEIAELDGNAVPISKQTKAKF